MSLPPLVLVAEPLPPEPMNWLASRCRVAAHAPDAEGFAAALAEAEGLVVRTATCVDAALLERAPGLRVVGRAGVGVESIDVAACRARGVEVVHTPDANTEAVVEYVLWLIGDALRPRATLTRAVDRNEWSRLREELTARRQLDECTIGILGFGRIGSRLAEMLELSGAALLCCDLLEIPEFDAAGATQVGIDDLFATCDIVSIHVDGRPANRHLVGADLLSRMKPDAILINTARGLVVDAPALAEALGSHPGRLALLDVHDPEPIPADNPLLGLANCHLFPHLASRTERAVRAMGWVVRDVVAVLEGQPPRHPASHAGQD